MDVDGIIINGFSDPRPLGRGASSVVFRAVQDSTGAERAVKVVIGASSDFRRQFLREKKALASLHHPNIVAIMDAGTAVTKEPYLVTDYYSEGSLDDRLKQTPGRRLSEAEVQRIGLDLTSALDAAHRGGWLHRDIKPANILVRGDHVALADFGIARDADALEHTSSLDRTTPLHAAPETLCGDENGVVQPPTPSSDLYSLASTLYTLLAGQAPFAGSSGSHDSFLAFLGRLCDQPVRPLDRSDLGGRWDLFFERALRKTPEGRFASADEFAAALRALSPPLDGRAGAVADLDDTIDLGRSHHQADPNADAQPDAAGPHAGTAPGDPDPDPDLDGTILAQRRRTDPQGETRPLPVPAPKPLSKGVMGGIAAGIVVIVVCVLALLLRPSSDEGASTEGTTDTVATNAADEVEALAPTAVAIDEAADPLRVTWEDHGGGQYPYLVISARAGSDPTVIQVPVGADAVDLPDLDPSDQACVYVRMVLETGVQAEGRPACINGAVPVATTTP